MKVQYLAQPDTQLGLVLAEFLDLNPAPNVAVFVSAFVGLQTIMRVKNQILNLKTRGCDVRLVLGIDLGGTSHEVLEELLGWDVDVRIIKHRIPGHTFHPKLYFFQWNERAEIIIGSNNITEGGFFGNYEGAVRISYTLPQDSAAFDAACSELRRFLDPGGPTVYGLTLDFLRALITRGEVPTEAEARWGRDVSLSRKRASAKAITRDRPLFGTEDIKPPPPLPANLLERLVREVRRRRQENRKTAEKTARKFPVVQPPLDAKADDVLLPAAFYMTLPTLQGPTIPGEARIPLEAIELAKEFWGWPDEYAKDVSPHTGAERVYWNWRPLWRVWSVEQPGDVAVQQVRMYMYENSSDFRFYARPLVNAGGNVGDVVRIRRLAQHDAEYECILARQGTAAYTEWITYCTQPVRNSPRRFGYA